jgi:hypothetical protein
VAVNNYKGNGLKSYIWLFIAVICIVFSSASKRLIEAKVNPSNYNPVLSFNKKIKDGSRDRHEYLTVVVHAGNGLASGDNIIVPLLLSALISLALLYSYGTPVQPVRKGQPLVVAGLVPMYLWHRRLLV